MHLLEQSNSQWRGYKLLYRRIDKELPYQDFVLAQRVAKPGNPASWRDGSQNRSPDWAMLTSGCVGSFTLRSSRFFGSIFFFCARLGKTRLLWSCFRVRATIMTGISLSISMFSTLVVGSLDIASAFCCFTPDLCTISKSHSINHSCPWGYFFVVSAWSRIHRNV